MPHGDPGRTRVLGGMVLTTTLLLTLLPSRGAFAEPPQDELRVLNEQLRAIARQNELLREEIRLLRAQQIQTDPERKIVPERDTPHDGIVALNRAINSEFRDVAGAIRGLDQSYSIPGHSSGKAWSASSHFFQDDADRPRAASVTLRERVQSVTPQRSGELLITPQPRGVVQVGPRALPAESKLFSWSYGRADNVELLFRKRACVKGDRIHLSEGVATPATREAEILRRCQQTNEFTLDVLVCAKAAEQFGPARIVTFSESDSSRNFLLGQVGGQFCFRLRTTETAPDGGPYELRFGRVTPGKPTHVRVSYRPGELVAWVDGIEVVRTDRIRGGLQTWTKQHFLFGDEWGGGRNWRGNLIRVAFYDRADCVHVPDAHVPATPQPGPHGLEPRSVAPTRPELIVPYGN